MKNFMREEIMELYKTPPYSLSGYALEQRMRYHDEAEEFRKNHPDKVPKNMKQVSFDGFSSDTIDDNIEMVCGCSEGKFGISGGYITFCPRCGRGYRVINYIAQYEVK